MGDEPIRKKVDESWKEQVAREKQQPGPGPALVGPSGQPVAGPAIPPLLGPSEGGASPAGAPGPAAKPAGGAAPRGGEEHEQGLPEARFDLFISGLAVESLVAMGDMPHPVTRKPAVDLAHARYMIDLLGIFEEKTRGNLTVDEEKMLKDALYQLRMRYLAKTGAGPVA